MKIKNFENYEVTCSGEVINTKTGRVLKQIKQHGYLRVGLCRNGKQKLFSVHRLVAEAFIPNPNNLPCVNHKDENPLNNNVENLEWCTCEYNNNYGTRKERAIKNKKKPILQLRKDGSLIRVWLSASDIEKQVGYNSSFIYRVCLGKSHTAYGYKWCYA